MFCIGSYSMQAVAGRVKAGKVDCMVQQWLCQQAQIRSYPAIRYYAKNSGQTSVSNGREWKKHPPRKRDSELTRFHQHVIVQQLFLVLGVLCTKLSLIICFQDILGQAINSQSAKPIIEFLDKKVPAVSGSCTVLCTCLMHISTGLGAMLPRSFRCPSVKQSLQDRTDIWRKVTI